MESEIGHHVQAVSTEINAQSRSSARTNQNLWCTSSKCLVWRNFCCHLLECFGHRKSRSSFISGIDLWGLFPSLSFSLVLCFSAFPPFGSLGLGLLPFTIHLVLRLLGWRYQCRLVIVRIACLPELRLNFYADGAWRTISCQTFTGIVFEDTQMCIWFSYIHGRPIGC